MHQPHAHHHPQPGHHGPPHVATLLPHLSAYVRARVSTPSVSTPHATPLSPRHAAAGQRTPRRTGRDNHVPPQHCRPPPTNPPTPRTRQQRPHQSVNTQTSKEGKGRRDTERPTTPPKRKHPKNANTPSEHTSSANTKPQPPTEQTRPQASLLFHHPREHKAPTQ